MKLTDFPYITTNKLVKYSKLITKAIVSFSRNYVSELGTITHDFNHKIPPNEDRLEYWNKWDNDITFGRYLLFTKKKEKEVNSKEEIPLWTGLSSTKTEAFYCIWFKKNDISQYIEKLKIRFKADFHESKYDEIWISIESKVFDMFCNPDSCANCRRQIVKDFLHSVLIELK